MKLKVCGMKFEENLLDIAEVGADYLGFIFYKKSSRYFTGNIPKLPKAINKVGVFVNAPIAEVISTIIDQGLDSIQLHGDESPEYCCALSDAYKKTKLGDQIKIIKAFSVNQDFDFPELIHYENNCDYYLFDTKGKLPGGNGFTFNWNILRDYSSSKPYFLSGGIGIDETDKILEFLKKPESNHCHAIDVNSRFEIEPGLKNTVLIKKFKHDIKFNRLNNEVFKKQQYDL